MNYVLLFLVDIVLGYGLQSLGCAMCLFTITKNKIKSKKFVLVTLLFTAVMLLIRVLYNFGLINFGFHTILIWVCLILLSITMLKFPIFTSTVAILISGVTVITSELVNIIILRFAMGEDTLNSIMENTVTTEGKFTKALCGIPTNILFLIIMVVFYLVVKNIEKKKKAKFVCEE